MWPRQRTVETEHHLPNGGVADIAVCVRNETKVVIEVFNTHRTATIDSESARSRPEPWYEVRVDDVLRMLHSTQYYGELECVRPDRVCPECKRLQRVRNRLGNWTLKTGRHENKTFEQASSDEDYVNWLLGRLVKGQYHELDEQIRNGYYREGAPIAFEMPKGDHMNVSSVFRDSGLRNGSILAFIGYLIFLDPDLSAIEFAGGKLAKRVWKPYEPGQKQAKRVTLVKFDSRSGNWTNPWDAYEDRYYIKGRDGCGRLGWFRARLSKYR